MSTKITGLLAEALEAHGGLDRWNKSEGLTSSIVTGGVLWGLKGIDMDGSPRRVKTRFRDQWTQTSPFGAPDWVMTWQPEHLEIRDGTGALVAERDNGRDAFDRSFEGKWDPLNFAYFNGYAMWTYHAAPFVFAEPGFSTAEIDPIIHDGEELRGLEVTFPDHFHSHTQTQRFYFGADGLLRRHDYEVDVWANAKAAHLLSDYVDVEGLKFPSRRHVYPRQDDGSPDYSINTVSIELTGYELS